MSHRNNANIIFNYHLCFCLYIFRRLIVARSLMLFPPAPLARSVKYILLFNNSSVKQHTAEFATSYDQLVVAAMSKVYLHF